MNKLKIILHIIFISKIIVGQNSKFVIEKKCKSCDGNYIYFKNKDGQISDTLKVHIGNNFYISGDTIFDIIGNNNNNDNGNNFSIGIKK